MADQTVRIENMPDSGSPEAVALVLWRMLRTAEPDVDAQLDLYSKCLAATTTRYSHDRGKRPG